MDENDIDPTNADKFLRRLTVTEADTINTYINVNQIDKRNFLSLRIFSSEFKGDM